MPIVGGGGVTSIFTRTGAVVAAAGDYEGVVAAALTGATAATRYVGGTASGAPASGTFAVGDFVIDQTGKVQICTVAGTPGTWVAAGGTVGAIVQTAYTENTALNLTVTGSEQSCGVDTTFTADGTTRYIIDFFAPILAIFSAGDTVLFRLRENPAGANTDRGILGQYEANGVTAECSVFGRRAITPSAGSVTYRVTAIKTSGAGSPSVQSGTGGAGAYVPASLLVRSG